MRSLCGRVTVIGLDTETGGLLVALRGMHSRTSSTENDILWSYAQRRRGDGFYKEPDGTLGYANSPAWSLATTDPKGVGPSKCCG